ncbi:hypothetical protein ABPG75_011235 [Micractinium tetrahymenae]
MLAAQQATFAQSASARPCAAPSASRADSGRSGRAALVCRAAASNSAAAAAPTAAPPSSLLALKEWAPTCAAIAAGEQTILLRKGGIKEPTFTPAAREFLLFPTSFHTDAQLLKPGAAQRYEAECAFDPKAQATLRFATRAALTGAWTTTDPAVLQLLDGLHVWAPGFLEDRLRWRKTQPITVLELRAVRLLQPLELAPRDDFWGCFSWLDLAAAPEGSGAEQQRQAQQVAVAAAAAAAAGTPALGDAAFAELQALCRRQLAQLGDLQELVLP